MLAGAGVFLLPVLLAAAIVKKGNLANDGIKLGRNLSTCSRDPSSSLLSDNTENGNSEISILIYSTLLKHYFANEKNTITVIQLNL